MMREFLVTKMVCSKCGSNLELTYDMPKVAIKYADGEPSGAAMVQMRVAVEPCKHCMGPMDEMRKAAKLMIALLDI
jgi:hypothetical protein